MIPHLVGVPSQAMLLSSNPLIGAPPGAPGGAQGPLRGPWGRFLRLCSLYCEFVGTRKGRTSGYLNGAHCAKSNDLAMLCYVQASEELEYNWFAIRLGFIDFLSNWASWAPFEKLDDLVLGRVWAKKLELEYTLTSFFD